MTPYSRSSVQRSSREQQVLQAANPPGHSTYWQFLRTPPSLGQRAPSDASVHIRAPALRASPTSINFPCAPPSHSQFVLAPHQPSPTEQRKRAKSQVGPKPPMGLSRRPSLTSSFRSPTVSPGGLFPLCSHLQTTHTSYVVEDTQNSRHNFQSTVPDGQVAWAGSGYPSIAQPSRSSASDDTQRTVFHQGYVAAGGQNAHSRRLSRTEDLFSNSNSNFESTYSSYNTKQKILAASGQPSAQGSHPNFSRDDSRINSQSNVTAGAQKARVTASHSSTSQAPSYHDSCNPQRPSSRSSHTHRPSPSPRLNSRDTQIPSSSHGSRDTQKSSSEIEQVHPMLSDIALVAAVGAALADHREFLWYGVWSIAIKDHMFYRENMTHRRTPSWVVKVRTQKFVVPNYLKRLSGNDTFSFKLMDRSGKSAVAFKFIADRIKARESDFWGLPLPKPIKQ
ncbi:hypothetical protein K503DRAFT_796691 [Rhizopogon vinicolor AM-OR11-026]|uniref:Uncharacterized protein n=1 Tax=Rhizopogon vinicolor AM-OR11-026 TaxID=1314800 RepID=A0A1B7NDX6_9AGAM|nr:hypothetical protein K503DRAFT_796691 [Rhizopogon vinicolor AM-OR11-026]